MTLERMERLYGVVLREVGFLACMCVFIVFFLEKKVVRKKHVESILNRMELSKKVICGQNLRICLSFL